MDELKELMTVEDADGVMLKLSLNVEIYFRNAWRTDIREAVLAVFNEYREYFGQEFKWTTSPNTGCRQAEAPHQHASILLRLSAVDLSPSPERRCSKKQCLAAVQSRRSLKQHKSRSRERHVAAPILSRRL